MNLDSPIRANIRKHSPLEKALDLIHRSNHERRVELHIEEPNALNPNDLPSSKSLCRAGASPSQSTGPWLQLATVRRQFGQSERLLNVMLSAQHHRRYEYTVGASTSLVRCTCALTGRQSAWIASALDAMGVKLQILLPSMYQHSLAGASPPHRGIAQMFHPYRTKSIRHSPVRRAALMTPSRASTLLRQGDTRFSMETIS